MCFNDKWLHIIINRERIILIMWVDGRSMPMYLRTKRRRATKWIDRRTQSERRNGLDRRNLFRFESIGADRRVGKLRRVSDWPML